MRLALFITMCLFVLPVSAQQGLISDLSERRIDIQTQFAGADLLLFGAIGRGSALGLGQGFDIVAVVRGPEQETVVRKKERVLGLWMNRSSVKFQTAVGYYAVAATRALENITDADTLSVYQLGIDHVLLSPVAKGDMSSAELRAFREGLLRHLQEDGLFQADIAPIEVSGDTLFRTRIKLPAKVPVGDYTIDIFLFSGGKLIEQHRQHLAVDKSGLERWIYAFAQERPLYYGLTAVLIALSAGWLAGFVYRKH